MYGVSECKLMQTHFFCADKRNGFPIPKKSRRGISFSPGPLETTKGLPPFGFPGAFF